MGVGMTCCDDYGGGDVKNLGMEEAIPQSFQCV